MRVTNKLLFQIEDFLPKGKSETFGTICRKFSEKTSLQSVPSDPKEVWLRDFSVLKHPHGALAVILALSQSRTNWSCAERYEKILTHIYNLCKNHNFQGGWIEVATVLSIDFFQQGQVGTLTRLPEMSPEDFFGNLLPKAYSIIERNLIIRSLVRPYREISRSEKYRGIRRKVRRRGYSDKGSLRPSHKWLPSSDWSLDQKELQREQLFNSVPQLKHPKKRYWYRSTFPEDGPNSSIKLERSDFNGTS